ncbi:hypothetical protein EV702DRAFT_1195552 [Suillus placidus]|uniref:Uncharacterized protein n=1 Tax=Suillus placidus TaxID=48579 RepID=A0A9P6ZYB1_9AGAM|nr:hypothetical protein EV702DRAFT_1195552 [Suillus placidus]
MPPNPDQCGRLELDRRYGLGPNVEQSVAGALSNYGADALSDHDININVNLRLQLGTTFGLTTSTTMFDSVVKEMSAQRGVTLDSQMTNAPASENLSGYRAAQWTAASCCLLASLLGLVLVRSVGL